MSLLPAGDRIDPADANLVQGAPVGLALLLPFNRAGVLAAADVHTAGRLMALGGDTDDQVGLAVALAVRAPRVGHVSVDLAGIRASAVDAADQVDLDSLPWPAPAEWLDRVARSDLVTTDPAARGDRPLVLSGRSLYLERYWNDEMVVAGLILARLRGDGAEPAPAGGETEARLARLFPGVGSADQLTAARAALSGRFTVIAGGPGTGKTTTVARLLALLFEEAEAAGARPPLVGLAAPTGKAAARMEEAVRTEASRLDTSPATRTRLSEVRGSTLHRLLGTRFDRPGRFRHHAGHRLPHDVVVVDEASMVSLSLMARLAEAVRSDARLVLVGDPEQLVSVEAGAVLADIVGPAAHEPPHGEPPHGEPPDGEPPDGEPPPRPAVSASICVLRRNHRFTGELARLADAVRSRSTDGVMAALATDDPSAVWVEGDPAGLLGEAPQASGGELGALRDSLTDWAAEVRRSAAAGDAAAAIASLRRRRVLCAHRRGPAGVGAWNRSIEGWLGDTPPSAAGESHWYPGRPVLVTANDYGLRLFNGDTGVALQLPDDSPSAGRLVVAFEEGPGEPPRLVSPSRLDAVETVFAMTVHKSQGSEFDHVTLLLPPATSRLLTTELLYTAITRARQSVSIVGTADALRVAVETPIARASGLGRRLWGDATGG